ncbi:NinX [Vibrio phage 1.005.O._10N.286.48.F2]|nr:NinX [Vibrio phage 1.005.O._10N.286.48.F2]
MNYEDMNINQINANVTREVFGCHGWEFSENGGDCSFYHCGVDGNGYYEQAVLDYCNNPSDAWTIIVENKINIEWRDSLKLHPLAKGTGGNACHWSDKNPLRAAMICFLKMKDAENGR